MDETGADYTEWSKPERKTPIQYTNACLDILIKKKFEYGLLALEKTKAPSIMNTSLTS